MPTWCSGWKAMVELVRADLETPGVGGDRGDLGAMQPVGGGERQPRRVAAGVVAPALAPGPGDTGRCGPGRGRRGRPRTTALRGDRRLEVLDGDREPVRQLAAGAVRVARRPGRRRAAPRARRSGRRRSRCPVTRSPALVTTSPARRPLYAMPWSKMWPRPSHCVEHCSGMNDHVVGAADPVREPCTAALGVQAGVQHGVHRVGPPPPAASAGRPRSNGCDSENAAPRRTSPRPGGAWRRPGSSGCRARRRRPTGRRC